MPFPRGGTRYPCDITSDINFDHLVKVMFAMFFHNRVAIFPPYSILRKQVTKSNPRSKGGVRLNSISWRGSIYVDHLEFFCLEYLSLLPHLFISISVNSHMFILYFGLLLQYYIILLPTLLQLWALGGPLVWLLCPFDMLPFFNVF